MDDAQLAALAAHDIRQNQDVLAALLDDSSTLALLARWSRTFASSLADGGTLFFAGNGGSFADALHLAAEFTGKMGRKRPPLSAYALGTNGSATTAIGNDYDFEQIFSRELRGLHRPSSALLVMSTSGNSPNVLRLVETALDLNEPVLALTGGSGGALADMCDAIVVPSARTERIQEAHILLGHILCGMVENHLAGNYFEWD